MARKKHVPPAPDIRADREVRDESRAGTVVRLVGERGTYRVYEEVLTDTGAEWIVLFAIERGQYRHVRPDRVRWPKPPREKRGKNALPT